MALMGHDRSPPRQARPNAMAEAFLARTAGEGPGVKNGDRRARLRFPLDFSLKPSVCGAVYFFPENSMGG
jgi:hypothetical protein